MFDPFRPSRPSDILTEWRRAIADLDRTPATDPRRCELVRRVERLRLAYGRRFEQARAAGAVPQGGAHRSTDVSHP